MTMVFIIPMTRITLNPHLFKRPGRRAWQVLLAMLCVFCVLHGHAFAQEFQSIQLSPSELTLEEPGARCQLVVTGTTSAGWSGNDVFNLNRTRIGSVRFP